MLRPTTQKLVTAAQASIGSSRALGGRASSLQILCDQLEHTQATLARLEEELEQLIRTDPNTKGLQQMPELGPRTVAMLRAELGEVNRFTCTDQTVAYTGMDIEIKESGKFKGKAKLSRRGSGLLRQILSFLRHPQYSSAGFRLWSLLSSPGGARIEENVRVSWPSCAKWWQ
jgi:transposase